MGFCGGADAPLVLRKTGRDGGYEVWSGDSLAGYVYPDAFGGYKPFTVHGRSMRNGFPASRTPWQAAGHLLGPAG